MGLGLGFGNQSWKMIRRILLSTRVPDPSERKSENSKPTSGNITR